jgi:hypothetical protein
MDETKHALIIDLNRYRVRELKAYLDAGVDGFIFRIGGPSQWVEGDYRYKEDETWRPYLEQADKCGVPRDRIGGYIVHNPFEDWRLAQDIHLDCLNQWTSGGYQPGYYILDHEIATCWRGASKITATPYNVVASLNAVTDKIAKQTRRPVMIYTARWFTNSNGPAEHVTFLDNINRPEVGKQRLLWYAWYLTQYDTKTYASARQAISDLPTPTGDQVGKLLQCGSYSLWDLWQFTAKLKITGDAQGVDASVTRLSADAFWAQVGASTGPEPEQPPVVNPEYVTRAEWQAFMERYEAHTHTTGGPG